MPTTRPHVPGWHPDPEDPASLRHWDGKRWGTERRPRPSWAPASRQANLVPTGPGAAGRDPADGDGRPEGGSRRRWYLLAAGAVLLAFLVISVPAWIGSGPTIAPRSVNDTAFTTLADAACAKAMPALRKDRPESREDNGTPAAFAARIERAATGLEAVAADLRRIPLATADGASVDRWLDDWDAYTALGHRYAGAIRARAPGRSQKLSAQSQTLSRRVYLFAMANDMPNCIF